MPMNAAWLYAGDDPKQFTAESCLECHDEDIGGLTTTVHLPLFDVSCQDCHVDVAGHMEDEDVKPTSPSGAEGQSVCLSCHDSIRDPGWGDTEHLNAGVTCDDCHQSHEKDHSARPLLLAQQQDLCLSCHEDTRVAFAKPYTHKTGRTLMECSSCHNPHGGRGAFSLKSDHTGGGPCVACHTEKRGPFVFEHVSGITGDCQDCHEHHGSSNPAQLIRANVSQLCLECHTAVPLGPLGSQPPAFHDLRSPRYRDCTVCHTAVHGSYSSPTLVK